jgi:hypothetical protein
MQVLNQKWNWLRFFRTFSNLVFSSLSSGMTRGCNSRLKILVVSLQTKCLRIFNLETLLSAVGEIFKKVLSFLKFQGAFLSSVRNESLRMFTRNSVCETLRHCEAQFSVKLELIPSSSASSPKQSSCSDFDARSEQEDCPVKRSMQRERMRTLQEN